MAKLHTHYDNLKVTRNAPPEVIRAAYKTLSQKYHPDKHPGNADAERVMALVNASYQVLSDPVKRAEHDRWIAREEAEAPESNTSRASPPPTAPPSAAYAGTDDQPAPAPRHELLIHAVRYWALYGFIGFRI